MLHFKRKKGLLAQTDLFPSPNTRIRAIGGDWGFTEDVRVTLSYDAKLIHTPVWALTPLNKKK